MPYPLAPPQGRDAGSIFENKQSANGTQHSAKANPEPNHKGQELT
jgi:hypothetical protein